MTIKPIKTERDYRKALEEIAKRPEISEYTFAPRVFCFFFRLSRKATFNSTPQYLDLDDDRPAVAQWAQLGKVWVGLL